MRIITSLVLATALLAGGTGTGAQPVLGENAPSVASRSPELVRVRYIVNDVSEAVAFYAKLGFELDMQSGPYFAALSRGGVQLLLSPAHGPGGASQPMPDGARPAPGGGWNRLVLNTSDLAGDIARLRKEGVTFRNDIVRGLGGDEVLLIDPSGNMVELFQPTLVLAPSP